MTPQATMTVEQALQLAHDHHDANRLAEAEAVVRQILAQQPAHAGALHLLGVLAHRAGHNDHSADLIRRSLALSGDDPIAYYNLGIALGDQRKFSEAEEAYRHAIRLKPQWAEVWFNLATVLRDARKLDDAAAAYTQALQFKPNDPATFNNLGSVLKEQGKYSEAIAAFQQAIALNPINPGAHNNLGNALREQGRAAESILEYQKAIQLKPDYARGYNNLGNALRDLGQLDAASDAYVHATRLAPNDPDAHSNLGNVLKDQGLIDEALASYDKAIALHPGAWWLSNRLYAIHLHPAFDAPAILAECRKWNERYGEPLKAQITPHTNSVDSARMLRIAFVSPDFRLHPVGRFLLPVLTHLDRQQFEIFCYSDVRTSDELTERLRGASGTWRNIVGLSDEAVSQMIRQDEIDVLIDLTMHAAGNRLLTFARKPAPVQVTWLAYCSTTGLDAIDYRLTDIHIDPPGQGDENYSEKSVRLPETWWCYEPVIATPDVGKVPALTNGYITFGCLNNFAKFSSDALLAWRQILSQVPQSRLVLHAKEGSHRQRVLKFFQQENITPDRIQFTPFISAADYYKLYETIDIALDAFPCAGGTTTCDALWMGVPVISLSGKTAVGRIGASMLNNVGLGKLVGATTEQYVRLAVKLASEANRLVPIRAALRERLKKSPLGNAPRFAKNLETALRQLWGEWCATATA